MSKAKKKTVGERIAEEAVRRALNINMSNTRESRKDMLARRIDAAIRRAATAGFNWGRNCELSKVHGDMEQAADSAKQVDRMFGTRINL